MTIKRMDHVSVVVEDLAFAIAFFTTLGMALEGEAAVEGPWVGRARQRARRCPSRHRDDANSGWARAG
jgi:catechol 2,3-dioxygenase-like lactoylglutathione lyase family enzyme